MTNVGPTGGDGPMTTAEAAAELGISPRQVVRAARNGTIPYLKKLDGYRGAYLFAPDVIEAERQRREQQLIARLNNRLPAPERD